MSRCGGKSNAETVSLGSIANPFLGEIGGSSKQSVHPGAAMRNDEREGFVKVEASFVCFIVEAHGGHFKEKERPS